MKARGMSFFRFSIKRNAVAAIPLYFVAVLTLPQSLRLRGLGKGLYVWGQDKTDDFRLCCLFVSNLNSERSHAIPLLRGPVRQTQTYKAQVTESISVGMSQHSTTGIDASVGTWLCSIYLHMHAPASTLLHTNANIIRSCTYYGSPPDHF